MAFSQLDKKVTEKLTVKDLAALGFAKVGTEKVYSVVSSKIPQIPENPLISGVIKIGLGVMIGVSNKNKTVRFASAGVVLDGFEDLLEMSVQKVESNTDSEDDLV